ncbi:MAG TPA: Ig-like domain-containing protein [Gemmatimonadaceae bacterium]|nr:Ig-like domain-containing protein [Gemmatimonadaceae bacterium]
MLRTTPRPSSRSARRAFAGASLLLTIALPACSGGGGNECDGIVAPTRVLTPSPAALTLDAGGEGQVTASLSGGCSDDDRTVRWTTSDAAIATVDAGGRVRAVSSGTATLTATAFDNQASTTVAVTVRARVATTIEATPALDTLSPLGTRTLSVTVRDQAGVAFTTPPITWRSLNPTLATVSPVGLVTAVAAGTASIEVATPRAGADSLRDTVRIIVVPACSIIRPVQLGSTVNASFDASTCQNLYGFRIANQYSVTVAEATYYSVRLVPTSSAALVPFNIGSVVSALPAADTAVTSHVAVRPGTYGFLVTAPAPGAATYSIVTARDPDPKVGCALTTSTFGVTFRTAILPTCATRDIRLLPGLTTGQTVRVTATAVAFPVTIELRNATSGALLQRVQATAANGTATINYVNGASGAPQVLVRVTGPTGANDFVTIVVAP